MIRSSGLYIRNIVFGVADSLVSTVGLLSGISASGSSPQVILLTGIVYAFVEAFSMAVGSFMSEQSAEEYAIKGEVANTQPFIAGTVMFVSFILASFIPIAPYMIFKPTVALLFSIIFSIIALFIVGLVSAKIVKVGTLKHGIRMMILGGAAIIIGVIVGKLIK